MIRVGTFIICLAVALTYNFVECSNGGDQSESNIAVAVVRNLTEYFEQNPGAKIVQELEKEPQAGGLKFQYRLQMTYKAGNRISGDRLLATASGNQSWTSPQDVTQTLSYPKSGIGAVITFVNVIVEQSTNLGRGVITSGGIGQRQITMVIESKKTLYFRYTPQIYGY